jgi:hypothetical protein
MDHEGLRELLREGLAREQTAPEELTLTDAQWHALSRVVSKRSLEVALLCYSGAPDIRLEDHAYLMIELARALGPRYPAAGRLISVLACDVIRIERDNWPLEPGVANDPDPVLERQHEQMISKHERLLDYWCQLREPASGEDK